MKKKYIITTVVTAVFLLSISLFAWLKPADDFSLAERRSLKQFPEFSFNTIISGKFMEDFEEYTLDQFPLRDEFRKIKALVSTKLFGATENNGIYVYDGYVSKTEYPLNEESVVKAGDKFEYVYNKYLKDTNTKNYLSVIPDKNYFLAEKGGVLSIDYDKMISLVRENTDFLQYIDITEKLSLEDYYKTDTHWRQEKIVDVAEALCDGMGATVNTEYTENTLDKEFYGVYYGQSALPLESETIKYLTNKTIENCVVFDYQNNKGISVYDFEKGMGKDPYELFLSGPISLITVENKDAKTDKELIIFRDSFGSSIAPLLIDGYSKITLVDIRYLHPNVLESYIEFDSQDVLFLYSTSVLNNSETIHSLPFKMLVSICIHGTASVT